MTTVRMKQVVADDLFMEPISNENNLPNTCNKPEARRMGEKRVSEKEHEEIMEEIACRAALEHDDSDSHSSSSDDSDDKSGTDNK